MCARMHARTRTHTHACTHTHTHACTHARKHTNTQTHTHAHKYTRTHTHAHTRTHTHTHAHTRTQVTPPESAEFMNRMMAEIWVPFVVPQTLRDNLAAWYVPQGCGWLGGRVAACKHVCACVCALSGGGGC